MNGLLSSRLGRGVVLAAILTVNNLAWAGPGDWPQFRGPNRDGISSETGQEQWRKDYTEDFGSKRPEWGYSESPLVDGDKVVVTPGGPQGAIVALNRKTGAVLWATKDFTDEAHYSSLIVEEIGGVRQY